MLGLMLIASYIKDDLAARLKSGCELPVELTIDSLASYYEVSGTPVRAAVAELVDEGLLEKGSNRRLVVRNSSETPASRSSRPPTTEPLPARPLWPQDAYDTVASDLVRLSLKGEAIYLREEATAEKYAMSRSAIRNILHRLAGEGVLDHIPRRGWRLRPFRQDDLREFVEVREVLELKALEMARPKLVEPDLRRMLDANTLPKSPGEMPRIDESLHQYFVKLADNHYIRHFFERQGRYYWVLFEWEDQDREIACETVRQHREVLTALLDRNWSGARRALSNHILNNHPILSQIAISKARSGDGSERETT